MRKKVFVSEDNIFAVLGLKDSEEMKIRSDLMSELVSIIRKSGIAQKKIAIILGISEPKVSALMAGKINDFSNDTLMNYLTLLGCNVEIKVLPQPRLSKTGKKGMMKVKRSPLRRGNIPRRRKVSSLRSK